MRNVVHKTESFSSIFVLLWSFSQVRELVTGAENCPYDWVRLYDGVDEYSPLIGHFCGTGSLPRFFAMFTSLQLTEACENYCSQTIIKSYSYRFSWLRGSVNVTFPKDNVIDIFLWARFFRSKCHRLYFYVCTAIFLDFGFVVYLECSN